MVVVSGGNEGFGSPKLNNPAYDPHVLAVGGADGAGTYDYKDDTIQSWSSRGDGTRNPDLVAPGASILSLRDPGSTIDTEHPTARVATRFFKGTGTSQAAAVVSGAAALVIQQRPTITPDQVKKLLTNGAQKLQKADAVAQGKGMMDLKFVRDQPTPTATAARRSFAYSTGTGSRRPAGAPSTPRPGRPSLTARPTPSAAPGTPPLVRQTWTGTTWTGGAWSGTAFTGGTVTARCGRTALVQRLLDRAQMVGTAPGPRGPGRAGCGRAEPGRAADGQAGGGCSTTPR